VVTEQSIGCGARTAAMPASLPDAAPVTPEVMATAIDLQHELARHGQHRVPIPVLIISAAALVCGLIVLHYDADFERIAAGGAPHEWVVPQGSG
jgi:predicted nucleic acid-binding protein